jgi:hypothetical protein
MILVKSFFYGGVLMMGAWRIVKTGAGSLDPLFTFYSFIMAGGITFTLMLLYDLSSNATSSHQPANP